MRRREVIAGLGGLATAWPITGRAQPAGLPKIGASILANPEPYWTLLREALRPLGYVEGRTVRLDFRSAEGNVGRLVEHTAELVRTKVDVVIAIQTGPVQEAMKATKDIPIVMIAASPVENGIISSLNRPGGNVTGVATMVAELAAKTLEIMREIRPSLRRAAVLLNARDFVFGQRMRDEAQSIARLFDVDLHAVTITTSEELEPALAALAKDGTEAVIAQPSLPRDRLIDLALRHRLPVMTANLPWARSGALMSYAADTQDVCGKAARYVDRILKGEKPADLPVQQPTRFELVINRKTAEAVGITLPLSVLARADEVIE